MIPETKWRTMKLYKNNRCYVNKYYKLIFQFIKGPFHELKPKEKNALFLLHAGNCHHVFIHYYMRVKTSYFLLINEALYVNLLL